MLPNYYFILRVDPSADPATIKAAYRRRAKECHPDRGGQHKEMVLVNEAWEILGDVERRQWYDEARRPVTSATSSPVAAEVQAARARAASYPARWSDFEKLLDEIACDFHSAEWITNKSNFWELPQTRRSASAQIFLSVGMVVGGVVGFSLLLNERRKIAVQGNHASQFPGQSKPPPFLTQHPLLSYPLATMFAAVCGAWLAKWLHDFCRFLLAFRVKPSRK